MADIQVTGVSETVGRKSEKTIYLRLATRRCVLSRTLCAIASEVDMKQFISLSVIARLVASVLLIWALTGHPYGYYTLLRWVVCAAGAYSAYVSTLTNRVPWVWFFSITAVFFNPIVPVKLDSATWSNIDVAIGIALLASIFFVRENVSTAGDDDVRE